MEQQKTKHTLFLREGDWDAITAIYAPRQISTSHVVRSLVSTFVDRLQDSKAAPTVNMDIDL